MERACAAAYYTSFASVGIVIYILRVKKGYRSLPEAINARYGPLASVAFGNFPTLHPVPCMSFSVADLRLLPGVFKGHAAGVLALLQACSGTTSLSPHLCGKPVQDD